jgi:cytochrome b involved in lipid metabolism
MALWGILALLIAVLFLVYNHFPMSWYALPAWLLPESWRSNEDRARHPDTPDQAKDYDAVIPDGKVLQEEVAKAGDSTPKTRAAEPFAEVPTFSLTDEKPANTKDDVPASPQPPAFPASNSAQHVSSAPPKQAAVQPAKPSASGLMPPPAMPPPRLRPTPPSAAASLRVPSPGPLPNRGPPANSQQRASSGLPANGTVPAPNPRGKVLLSPGHSPMDWAALTRSKNLAGVDTFRRVTPSQLRSMTGRKGKPAWSSWQGKVYNITPYLPFHPGGEAELMKAAGRDGTKLFMDVHPWVNWENMLDSCLVGVMVPEDYGMEAGKSSLEDMD